MGETSTVHKEDADGYSSRQDGFQRSAENCTSRSRRDTKPITHVSNDVGDIEALTPNHFLLLQANPSYADAEVCDREINSTKMWRQLQALANFFWRCFTKEYLPRLTERKKWKEKRQNLKEGDVVLVAEPNQPQGVRPLGRIGSTHPGRDGLVRAVTVRTQHGELKRPIAKLCLLEEAEE